ncbi:MAG: hypothetical protein ACRDV2_04780 [Actinomycetes bacterium]
MLVDSSCGRVDPAAGGHDDPEHAIQDIEAMLDAVPDLRDDLREATPEELAELLEAFDVTATYDKQDHRLHLAATVPGRAVRWPG